MANSFWQELESKKISKEQVGEYLTQKLGQPTNQIQTNLYQEIIKKINSYYFVQEIENYTVFSLIGMLKSPEQVIEKRFKEGKFKGQPYYLLKLSKPKGEKLQARKELLTPEKWEQIGNLAILGQNLVFKYRFWITNKELLDFLPYENSSKTLTG